MHSRALARLAALAVTIVLVLQPGTAFAAVPAAPVRFPAAIEGFATYQKQTTCSPTAKPGTLKLRDLLLRTYAGTRNLGISRACTAGGTSEHKEGRAFDWGVRVTSATERAQAQAFLTWLLKTDAAGHKAANARRLGVMYVIWNKHIWGAYANASGWRTYSGSNPHTDHVHISLSRSGGAGLTSFWTGKVNATSTTPTSGTYTGTSTTSAPKPLPIVPAPHPAATLPAGSRLQDETIAVPASRAGARTRYALVQGQRYRVEVRGTWQWNKVSGSVADGECSLVSGSDWWAHRWIASATGDQLGLYLDGRDLPLAGYSGSACASKSHTYVTTLTAKRNGRVPLQLWEPTVATGYADNRSSIKVRIIHDAPLDVLPVKLDTTQRWGTTTGGSVVQGKQYTVTVSGIWKPDTGVVADAICQDRGEGFRRVAADRGHRDWRVLVGEERLDAEACRPDHTYTWTITAPASGPVVSRVDDRDYTDNAGVLSIRIAKVVPPAPETAAAPQP